MNGAARPRHSVRHKASHLSNRPRKSAKTIGSEAPGSALFADPPDADTLIDPTGHGVSLHPPRGIGVRHPPGVYSELDPITPGAFVRKPAGESPELALGAARKIRRQRPSGARLARLLGDPLDADEDLNELDDDDEDLLLVRLLIASGVLRGREARRLLLVQLIADSRILRRKRARRMLLSYLLRECEEEAV